MIASRRCWQYASVAYWLEWPVFLCPFLIVCHHHLVLCNLCQWPWYNDTSTKDLQAHIGLRSLYRALAVSIKVMTRCLLKFQMCKMLFYKYAYILRPLFCAPQTLLLDHIALNVWFPRYIGARVHIHLFQRFISAHSLHWYSTRCSGSNIIQALEIASCSDELVSIASVTYAQHCCMPLILQSTSISGFQYLSQRSRLQNLHRQKTIIWCLTVTQYQTLRSTADKNTMQLA